MADQPRWPAGTPVRPDGGGPGGGRFRPVGRRGVGGWAEIVSGRLVRGWANDERSREELAQIAAGQWSWPGEELGGNTATTLRVDMPDGRSIVQKRFQGWFEEDFEDDPLAEAEGIFDEPYQTQQEDIDKARAEVVASLVAQAVGALVPPVVQHPEDPGTVFMGYIDGEAGLHLPGREDYWDELTNLDELDVTSPVGQEVVRRSRGMPAPAGPGPTGPVERATVGDLAERVLEGGWQYFFVVGEDDYEGVWVDVAKLVPNKFAPDRVFFYGLDGQYVDTRMADAELFIRRRL